MLSAPAQQMAVDTSCYMFKGLPLLYEPIEHCEAAAHAVAPLALAMASCVKLVRINQRGTGNVLFILRNKAQMSPVVINKAHAWSTRWSNRMIVVHKGCTPH